MNWLQVRIAIAQRDAAPIEAALLALGATSIEYQDAGDQPILEPAPGSMPLWRELYLDAMLDAATPPELVRRVVAAATAPAPAPAIRFATLRDRDWIAGFRETLEPMRFGKRLWILPHGPAAPQEADVIVRLEPGLAFGSGSHPSTALCLEWLESSRRLGRVLDYGCGSGVLALAALALGAESACAVDLDEQALTACSDNAERNGLDRRLQVCRPAELPAETRFDTLLANILSDTLIRLAPTLCKHLRGGARIALSGILRSQADAVRQGYAPWIEFEPPAGRDDWILLSGRARVTTV